MSHLLIVDDNPDNLFLLRTRLEARGFTVDEAENGADALERARENPPALIISDVFMPVMDGFSLLRQWRSDARLASIPFIIFAATFASFNDQRMAMELGADAFILKSTAQEVFMARLHEVLDKCECRVPVPLTLPQTAEAVVLRQYSQALVRKLEANAQELEQANEELRQEIAAHKQAQEARRLSEDRYRTLFDYAPNGILIADHESYYIDANPSVCRMLGYTRDELIGLHARDIVDESGHGQIEPTIQNISKRLDHFGEWKFRCKDGSTFDAEVLATQMPEGNMLGVIRDVTERNLALARFRRLVDSNVQGVVFWNTQGGVVEANDAYLNIIGYSREELNAGLINWAAITPPEYAAQDAKALEELTATGVCKPREKEYIHRDGTRVPVLIVGAMFEDSTSDGVGFVIDITERKQAEAHIQRLNRVYAVLSGINETIVREHEPQVMLTAACRIAVEKGQFRMAWIGLVDDDQGPIHIAAHAGADQAALDILEGLMGEKQAESRCWFTLHALTTGEHGVCNDIATDPRAESWRAPAMQRGYRALASFPLRISDRMAGTFNLYSDTVGFFNDDETHLLDELAMDIGFALEFHKREVESRRLEGQFRQAQKMEAVGQLAGGVAHDFNNLLTIINGYSDLLIRRTPRQDPNRELLEEILKAGQRSAALTHQLLAFSRNQVLAPKVLDLNAVVRDIEKMLRRVIGEDVQLVTQLHPRLDRVKADPGQLQQVLLNLAVNARDAMPRGGRLTIETSNVELDEDYTKSHAYVRAGSYVMLAVADIGEGIPEEARPHLFEPFFTTKDQGKGTGLGLAVIHGVIKQSGGSIEVESEIGKGTVFRIYLPSVGSEDTAQDSGLGSMPAPLGSETILLVEDEEAVRKLMCGTLQALGYTVLEAWHAEIALQIAANSQQSIHLLLTDVVMPKIGGRELAERLLDTRPELRVLYVSGYTDDAIVRHGIQQEHVNFLQKPFLPSELAHKVREVLAK